MKSNFLKRAITGVLFVVVLVGCILYSPLSFGILFTIIGALSVHEFAHLINQNGEVQINKTITALGGAYLFLAVMGFCQSTIGAQVFLPYLALLLYLIITELYLKKKNPIGNWAFSMLSQLYVALPFALLNVLAFQYNPARKQRDLQSHPTTFHLCIYMAELHWSILCRLVNRQASFVRTYFPQEVMGRKHRWWCVLYCFFIRIRPLLLIPVCLGMGRTGTGCCHLRYLG